MIKKILLIVVWVFFFNAFSQRLDTRKVYEEIKNGYSEMPSHNTFDAAMKGYEKLKQKEKFNHILTIIDFSLSSNKKRMWVINLETKKVLFHDLVAHGKNSGNEFAKQFSNIPKSNKSSLGFYKTEGTYHGKHGYSLNLMGLEKGINNNAKQRRIVMHGAAYVSKEFAEKYGRLGRSFGCPSIPMSIYKQVIDAIKGGSCLFIYHPNKEYWEKTKI